MASSRSPDAGVSARPVPDQSIVDRPEVTRSARRIRTSEAYRIAMVVPFSGPGGIFGPSCQAVSELACRELNAEDGIAGREVRLVYVDGGRDPRAVAAEVSTLIGADAIDAVTGWHISPVRQLLAPIVQGRIPYVYTSLYEGGEHNPGIYCSGETPEQQVYPAMRWLRDHEGVRTWYVVGADYVWPLRTYRMIDAFASSLGVTITGTSFVPMGRADDPALPYAAAASGCRGVLTLLVGQDAVDFNRNFARLGLSSRIIRFSPLMEENMLLASGPECTEGLYAAASYFRSLVTGPSLRLVGDYASASASEPPAPALNNMAQSCYQGIHTLRHLARRAGGLDAVRCDARIDGLTFDSPRGVVWFERNQAHQPVHLARADGVDFDVLTTF